MVISIQIMCDQTLIGCDECLAHNFSYDQKADFSNDREFEKIRIK
ncbi:unnamed protein product [Paramecium octaurelia]|uniref:Uncharacterized protein n=1 Tax=Paramecium octaurelia TaxID=43137 RepID=A0A8S1URJ8_PAROT|nr:unnamed protein product [Paramecium octaurelia]